MSIFGKIKEAIFGKEGGPLGDNYVGGKRPTGTPTPATTPQAAPPPPRAQPAPATTAAAPTPAPVAPAPMAPAQTAEQRLIDLSAFKGDPDLNWRTSIVDLLKLLDLDSSLDARKELAGEFGYTGARDGSAEMNIWLHKAVMDRLVESPA